MFSVEQIKYMQSIGLNLDFSHLSDEDYVLIEEKVGDAYNEEALDHEHEVTPTISICEAILASLV